MLIRFYILILIIFSYQSGISQYINTYSRDASNLKNKVLIVALEEPDKGTMGDLEEYGQEYAKAYTENISGLNKIIEERVNALWTFNNEKKFLKKREALKLFRSDKSKYALMVMEETIPEMQTFNFASNSNKPPLVKGWYLDKEKYQYNYSSRYSIKSFNVSKISILSPSEIIQVNLPRKYPSEGDIIFALKNMQSSLNYLNVNPESSINKYFKSLNSNKLVNKTLLIDKLELSKDITKEDLEKYYGFPIKIVDYGVIENAIKCSDSSYAYITISRYDPNNCYHTICSASDGEILFFDSFRTYGIGEMTTFYAKFHIQGITREALEIYAKQVRSKL